MRTCLLLPVIFLLLGGVARADAEALKSCPTPGSFDELIEWIEKVDTMKLVSKNDPPGDEDYSSPLGFVVRASCYSGARAKKKDEIIRRFNNVAGYMLQQTSRCYKLLGLPALPSIPSLLRTVEFKCASYAAETDAKALTEPKQDLYWYPLHRLFSSTSFHANSIGRHAIVVNTDKDRDQTMAVETMASLLLHELAHFTPSNNRSWHDAELGAHKEYSCDKSLFADRVYFMQAACFPQSYYGGVLYGLPLLKCGVCEKALGSGDSVDAIFKAYPHLGRMYKAKEMYIGKPIPKRERGVICNRLEGVARTRLNYLMSREDYAAEWIGKKLESVFDRLPTGELDGPMLASRFREYLEIVRQPFPKRMALKRLRELRSEIEQSVERFCEKFRGACKAGQEPFRSVLARGQALVEGLTPEQERALEFSFSMPEQLR